MPGHFIASIDGLSKKTLKVETDLSTEHFECFGQLVEIAILTGLTISSISVVGDDQVSII
jgi:hypothetical protein